LITEIIAIKHHHVFSCIPNKYLNNKSKAKDTVDRELIGQKKMSEEENQIYELSNTIKHLKEKMLVRLGRQRISSFSSFSKTHYRIVIK